MARKSQTNDNNKSTVADAGGGHHPRRLAVAVIGSVTGSVTSFWSLCSKQATKASRKLRKNSKIMPKSPAPALTQKPKKLLATISNKAIKLRQKTGRNGKEEELDFGDEGLWQREIMMGDKCQPLDFSGVIYYDKEGKRLSELPARSPRASPMHQYAYTSGKSDW